MVHDDSELHPLSKMRNRPAPLEDSDEVDRTPADLYHGIDFPNFYYVKMTVATGLGLEVQMLYRLTTAAVLALAVAAAVGVQAQRSLASAAVYDDFIRLPIQQRREQFAKMSAEQKAFIVRTHAERWVAANKAPLGSAELKVLQEATAFVTPEIYANPMNPMALKRENEVKANMRCRVNPNDAVAAFNVFDASPVPAERSRWTYLDQGKCWIGWFADGVADYLRTTPK